MYKLKNGYELKIEKQENGRFKGKIYKNGLEEDFIYFATYKEYDTEEELKERADNLISSTTYTEEELKEPVKDYTDFRSKIDYVVNHYLDGNKRVYAIYFSKEQGKKVDNELKELTDPVLDKVSMSYIENRELKEKHHKLYLDLYKQHKNKYDDFNYMRGAFKSELYNHEYIYNNYQGNFDVLSCFYDDVKYFDDDYNVQKYFDDLKMSDTEQKAYLQARQEYFEEVKKLDY